MGFIGCGRQAYGANLPGFMKTAGVQVVAVCDVDAWRMAEAKKRIVGQERNIAQAEKAVRIAGTRYRSGVGTQLELLDSQVAMTRARATHAQAIYDFLVAKAEWENAAGYNVRH